LVLITGKGAEQTMAVKNGYIPWDDRMVAREELIKLKK
jgi:UDP-N-acetylmuramyl tripeptide synthase